MTIYRGVSAHQRPAPGWFYHPNIEFARQFTQSGQFNEILKAELKDDAIYYHDPLPYGGDPDKVDGVIELAKAAGKYAVACDEGGGYEPSILVLKSALAKRVMRLLGRCTELDERGNLNPGSTVSESQFTQLFESAMVPLWSFAKVDKVTESDDFYRSVAGFDYGDKVAKEPVTYHVTLEANLPSVLKVGLLPSVPKEGEPSAVYLTPLKHKAKSLARQLTMGKRRGNYAVLQVNSQGLTLFSDPKAIGEQGVYCLDKIDPSRVSHIETVDMKHLSSQKSWAQYRNSDSFWESEQVCRAVDLDGTLANYDGWKGEHHIGEPVPKMLDNVKTWLKQGDKVVIFTARAKTDSAKGHIKKWLSKHGLPELEITNVKTPKMDFFYDDKAVGIAANTGLPSLSFVKMFE